MKFFTGALLGLACLQNVAAQPGCPGEPAVPFIEVIITQNQAQNAETRTAIENAFINAAARWSEIIKTDLPDITLRNNVDLSNRCGQAGAVLPAGKTVNNVIIFAEVRNIDGRGRILGQAGACVFNRVNGVLFPRAGSMTFDVNDVNPGPNFDAVVLHEMGHVLGIGNNQWRNLLRGVNNDPRYVGQNGLRGFADSGGQGQIDVEDIGGGGTALAHWRTSTFQDELMTGFLNNQVQKISSMTVGSLKDIGYDVDDSKADAFTVPGARRLEGISEEELGHNHARNLADPENFGWEKSTTPDISEEAAFLGPDGTYIASTKGLLQEEESNAGLIAGAGFAGAFIALAAAGAVVTIRNRQAAGAQVGTISASSSSSSSHRSGSSKSSQHRHHGQPHQSSRSHGSSSRSHGSHSHGVVGVPPGGSSRYHV